MKEELLQGSKDHVVGKALKLGPANSLLFWCYITLFLLSETSGIGSGDIKGSLVRTFVASGRSLFFWRPPEVVKVMGFSSTDGTVRGSVFYVEPSSLGS